MQERTDKTLLKTIERGIAINAKKGAANAWVYLIHHQLPRDIVAHILATEAVHRADATVSPEYLARLMAEYEFQTQKIILTTLDIVGTHPDDGR